MNSEGGFADKTTQQTRESAFGLQYVKEKRIDYWIMMLKGAAFSIGSTAFLMNVFPSSRTCARRCFGQQDFIKCVMYCSVQTLLMTLGGMTNNPTLR